MLSTGLQIFNQISWPARIASVAVGIVIFSVVMIEVTSRPGFCNSCHIMNPYYDNWKSSTHAQVSCLDCHLEPGIANYAMGKIRGLAQAVDCMVGRVATRPNATVYDPSCLRSKCHSTQELAIKQIDFNGVKFSHKNHVQKVVEGIKLSCATCHSHLEGDEHFSVNRDVCFACHFLSSPENEKKVVQTACLDCHEIPDKTIKLGLVTVNHAEFASHQASCENSCHKEQIQKQSEVPEGVCLGCHFHKKADHVDPVELHEIHTSGEKVECFACHGKTTHSHSTK